MGYTHYFTHNQHFTDEQWTEIASRVKKMISRKKDIAGWNGHGRPTITDTVIRFNGCDNDDDDSHETFTLSKDGHGFKFCKTARKPYDKYVVATLCLCHAFAPKVLTIETDGEPEDWAEGMKLAETVLGVTDKTITLPFKAQTA